MSNPVTCDRKQDFSRDNNQRGKTENTLDTTQNILLPNVVPKFFSIFIFNYYLSYSFKIRHFVMKERYNMVSFFNSASAYSMFNFFFISVYPTLLSRTKDITTPAMSKSYCESNVLRYFLFLKYPRNKTNCSFIQFHIDLL